ncbi:MAG: DUF3568 domain-containing protein [Syntrophales bacterium]|jgi:hypothetical protein|nr:DUF3568 domain-containing protein [Syntrophales bacterium]MDY0044693.1 DUF3568 family protein [Syntrophales bacterium]
MRHIKAFFLFLSIFAFCTTGCAPLVVGGAAVTAGAGTYIYMNGDLQTDYRQDFDSVWIACEKTMADIKAVDVIPVKEIGNGSIDANVDNEKVHISVKYKAKDLTHVSVRVGLLGDSLASQRIHDMIVQNL